MRIYLFKTVFILILYSTSAFGLETIFPSQSHSGHDLLQAFIRPLRLYFINLNKKSVVPFSNLKKKNIKVFSNLKNNACAPNNSLELKIFRDKTFDKKLNLFTTKEIVSYKCGYKLLGNLILTRTAKNLGYLTDIDLFYLKIPDPTGYVEFLINFDWIPYAFQSSGKDDDFKVKIIIGSERWGRLEVDFSQLVRGHTNVRIYSYKESYINSYSTAESTPVYKILSQLSHSLYHYKYFTDGASSYSRINYFDEYNANFFNRINNAGLIYIRYGSELPTVP
jgi:hypothetical protein